MHLSNTMHIGKNITETLWKILDGRHDKEKIVKICSDIQEANHAMKNVIQLNSDEDQINISALPWLLTEQQSNAIKEVIQKIRFPTRFAANINNIITKKGECGSEMKTHDWHTFIKVIILVYYIYLYNACTFQCIVFTTFGKIMKRSFYNC